MIQYSSQDYMINQERGEGGGGGGGAMCYSRDLERSLSLTANSTTETSD